MTNHTSDHHRTYFFSCSRFFLVVSSLFLAFLLAACSLGGGSTGTIPTTTSGNTPTATHPTSAPVTSLITYTGNGFRVGYPARWTMEKASPSAASIVFIDPTRTIEFIVTVTPNPNANSATSVALDPLLQSMQSKPHYQKVDLAPTTTVGGEAWDQVGAIGDLQYSGKPQSIQVNALAINRPTHDANTKMYKIQFSAPAKDFNQMNSATFQPMLQSFKFA